MNTYDENKELPVFDEKINQKWNLHIQHTCNNGWLVHIYESDVSGF